MSNDVNDNTRPYAVCGLTVQGGIEGPHVVMGSPAGGLIASGPENAVAKYREFSDVALCLGDNFFLVSWVSEFGFLTTQVISVRVEQSVRYGDTSSTLTESIRDLVR